MIFSTIFLNLFLKFILFLFLLWFQAIPVHPQQQIMEPAAKKMRLQTNQMPPTQSQVDFFHYFFHRNVNFIFTDGTYDECNRPFIWNQ